MPQTREISTPVLSIDRQDPHQSWVEAMLRVGVECACESGLLISTVVPRRRPPAVPALSISSESILCPFCVPCRRALVSRCGLSSQRTRPRTCLYRAVKMLGACRSALNSVYDVVSTPQTVQGVDSSIGATTYGSWVLDMRHAAPVLTVLARAVLSVR